MMMMMMRMMRSAGRLETRVWLALWLAVLQGSRNTRAAPGHSSPLQTSNWGNPRRFVHLRTSTDINNYYLEISLNGHVRKTTHRGSYSVVLLKSESRERIAILGVKSNRFLCMDALGNLFTSVVCQRDECLFHHRMLENHRDVYYSTRTGILLDLDGGKQVYTAGRSVPQSCLFLSERNSVPLERLQHRERRDRQTEASETHRARAFSLFVEESDSRAVRDDDADLELETPEDRNVSRETLASPNEDDPWDVEYSRNPGSPRRTGTVG